MALWVCVCVFVTLYVCMYVCDVCVCVHGRFKSACQRRLTLGPPISLWLANMAVYTARSRRDGSVTYSCSCRLPENYEAAFTHIRSRCTKFSDTRNSSCTNDITLITIMNMSILSVTTITNTVLIHNLRN